jgi:hypothetical protein
MPLNLPPLLKQLTIKTAKLGYRKLDLNYVDPDPEIGDWGWAQRPFIAEIERQYNAGKPVRIIVLKARQLGISTATEAVLFWWNFLHPGANNLVIAHENIPSTELFEMTKLFWETWPFKKCYKMKYQTKQNLHWEDTGSRLRIASAKNPQGTRGSTIHALHASEVAFWPDPQTLWTGLSQTIHNRHGTIVVLESTANGVGNWFYDQWNEAVDGNSDFVPLFFPWFKHSAYRVHTTLTVDSELDADEKQLLRIGASLENLAWRRWAIINKSSGDLDSFMQEYPSTPMEAFITSGRPIFSHQYLKRAYDDSNPGIEGRLIDTPNGGVEFVPERGGELTIFRRAAPGDTRRDRYFIAGDPSETIAGDPACIQVINRQTFRQVAVWHGRINPRFFADEMMRLGKYYNFAMLCPEVEGGGQQTIATILAKNYPNIWLDKRADRLRGSTNVFGWSTNYQRKQWCIGELQRLIIDGSLTIHDKKTYRQLQAYVQRDDGTWGNSSAETHDDAVMALAIAVTASQTEGPFLADTRGQNAILDLYHQEFDDVAV